MKRELPNTLDAIMMLAGEHHCGGYRLRDSNAALPDSYPLREIE
jgi:hypothetical protein